MKRITIGFIVILVLALALLAVPLATCAQQPAMPVIGLLSSATPEGHAPFIVAFRQGLQAVGYVEGQNVAIDYRWAEHHSERLSVLAADLVRRKVAVIAALSGIPAALPAKAATTTIPIVFVMGDDPVKAGFVTSLSRPGGNLTGVATLSMGLAPKRLELLHELMPTATSMALLVNPTNPNAEAVASDLQAAARTLGLQMHLLHASSERDIDTAFATLVQLRASGLVISSDAFFTSRRDQLAALAVRHGVPTVYQFREFVVAGGLMSYGGSLTDAYRLAGVYTGRILKGEKPADLPVQQSTKIELFINLRTAKAFGLTMPPSLLVLADEVIQ
jgi:ABC-type uncharacterized transport system substrate-binding protein